MKPLLDDAKKAEICAILACGGTFAMAADRVGCSRNTIYQTAKRDPAFRRKMLRAQTRPEKTFLKTIVNAAQETRYWAAARWALQHMYPDRYARRPLTMGLADVKDLISQIIRAIAQDISDSATRAAIRRRLQQLTRDAIRKCKKDHQEKARLNLQVPPPQPAVSNLKSEISDRH